jgi:hypothetical protein
VKEYCLTTIKKQWLDTNSTLPDFLPENSKETKSQNEQYIQAISNDFQKQFESFPRFRLLRKKWKKNTFHLLNEALNTETLINIHQVMDANNLDSFQTELMEFLRHVRIFAPELSFEGIGQATRNYVVYGMFKQLNELKDGFNKACFGYSMLYPFTDNYIDSKQFSDTEKAEYNQIIRDKINGKIVHPSSDHQRKTCELLEAIESVYDRDSDSTIFTLLIMILDAQKDSLRQQNSDTILTLDERLNISLYKGGVSVLIDQYFAKNEFNEEELNFYLSFGFFLQLVDDLQDIKEDCRQGNQTIFTLNLHFDETEKIVNKMLHFIYHITNSFQAKNKEFLDFLQANCYQLVYLSLVGSKEYFSKEYLDTIERYSLVTYPFVNNLKSRKLIFNDIKETKKYMHILDEMLIQ